MSNREKLISAVKAFRSAFDEAKRAGDSRIAFIDEFPRNWCNSATQLLLMYLDSQGFKNIHRVRGALQKVDEKHYWLEVDGMVIDITADQFGLPDVIVSEHSDWHAGLEELSRQPPWHPHASQDEYIKLLRDHDQICCRPGELSRYEIICAYISNDQT